MTKEKTWEIAKYAAKILLYTAFVFAALILAYNTYKEVGTHVYGKYFLSHADKKSIKDLFPWAAISFIALFNIYSLWYRKWKSILTYKEHCWLLLLQAAICNILFFSQGHHVIIVLNLSILYLPLFLFSFSFAAGGFRVDPVQLVPPIVLPLLQKLPIARAASFCLKRPSAPFIVLFMCLMFYSAVSLILELQKFAEDLADCAYFALIFVLVIELLCILYKYGNEDEKELY